MGAANQSDQSQVDQNLEATVFLELWLVSNFTVH